MDRLLRALARPPGVPSGLAAGAVVAGRYHLIDVVGRGGMGRVWRCHDRLSKRELALKELRTTDLGMDVRFRREFYAMTRLAHPSTVEVFDYGALPTGQRFLVMELVGGEDLRARVRGRPLPHDLLIRILVELSHVLAFIHSRLYVHCDIKADNVRLTSDQGTVKLLDFGLMHQLGTPAGRGIAGTPIYMAPEAITGGVIDARTDLYSLGVLGYELLAGRPPFSADTVAEVFELHERAPVPPIAAERRSAPELEAILARLMAKRPAERFQDAGELIAALAPISPAHVDLGGIGRRTSYLTTAELVGREQEMARLRRRLDEVAAGRGGALFLAAPAGVGKSRMIQELRVHAKLADLSWGIGHCRAEGDKPLRPLAQALAPIVELTPGELLAAPDWRSLFSGVAERLKAAARERPFVLCLEDLHWADAATVELSNALIVALAGEPALILGSFRLDEVDRVNPIYHTIHDGLTELLQLAPLGERETDALVSLMLSCELPRAFASRLHQTTLGNAFFVTETLRVLIEQGRLRLEAGRWRGPEDDVWLPGSLPEAVRGRLGALEPEALDLCRALAPLGRVFSLELAKPLSGLADEALFARLDQLIEHQFVQHIDDRYWFAHDSLQETIYSETPEPTRRRAHSRIAELLEGLAEGDPERAPVIGWHHARGELPARAIPFLRTAGESARARNLLLDATRHFKLMADLLEGAEPGPDRDRQLHEAWARVIDVAHSGDPQAAVSVAERLFPAWERRAAGRASGAPGGELPDLRLHRYLVASAYGSLGQLERSLALAEENLARSPGPDDPFRAGALLSRGVALIQLGRWRQLEAESSEAIEIFEERAADPDAMPRRLRWYRVMANFFRLMGQALMGCALDASALARGLARARSEGFDDDTFFLRLNQLIRAGTVGDPAGDAIVAELSGVVRRLGYPRLPDSRLYLFTPFHFIQRRDQTRQDAAIDKLASFRAVMEEDRFLVLNLLCYRALAAANTGELDRAEPLTDQAIVAARAASFNRLNLLLCTRGELHLTRGERDAARGLAGEALERARDPALANPFDQTVALRVLGEAAGGSDGASLLRESLALARAHDNHLHAGRALLSLGRSLTPADPEGRAALAEARQVFESLRADAWLRDVSVVEMTFTA